MSFNEAGFSEVNEFLADHFAGAVRGFGTRARHDEVFWVCGMQTVRGRFSSAEVRSQYIAEGFFDDRSRELITDGSGTRRL